jgi:pimeloyl-ACP methyl ester carboxylesterase
MPMVPVNGVKLNVIEKGEGHPVVFLHEFAGNANSWAPQFRRLARKYRCIAYNARGYSPSDVPQDENLYGQEISIADLGGLLDALQIEKAHLVGLSMGAYTSLVYAMRNPGRVTALVAASGGSGSSVDPAKVQAFQTESRARADRILSNWTEVVKEMTTSPARLQLKRKDPKGYDRFVRDMNEASPRGSAMTMRKVQAERPTLTGMGPELQAMTTPTLLIAGDEDEACIDINIFLKRHMPCAGLAMMPKAGHLVNLEDPTAFNTLIETFFAQAEAGAWPRRTV